MKVLVTGSTGFVGQHLCQLLHQSGHQVYALARSGQKFVAQNVAGTMIQGDLDNVDSLVKELPLDLDAVVHTAAIVHAFTDIEFHQTNYEGTKNLFSALKNKYEKLHFVFLSSLASVGASPNIEKLTEQHHPRPIGAYGKSKLLCEEMLTQLRPKSWSLTIIRPPIVIGPGDTGMLEVFQTLSKGITIGIGLESSKKFFSFIAVFDLVSAIKLTLQNPHQEQKTYFVSHPSTYSYFELMKTIGQSMGKNKILFIPLPKFLIQSISVLPKLLLKNFPLTKKLTPTKIAEVLASGHWICSGEKIEKELGLKYVWDLKKISSFTAKDYSNRGWL